RRKAFLAEIVDARAEPPQRVHQIADRALVHAWRAREPVLAPGKREDCGKRPEDRAGVAEVKVGGLVRERPAAHRGRIARDADAQKLEGVQHHAGVVGIQQVLDARLAVRQRGEQQHAIGDALRSGQLHRALHPRDRTEIEELPGTRALRRTAPRRSFSPPWTRGGENPGAALIAYPSASGRARRARPKKAPRAPWRRRARASSSRARAPRRS